MTKTIMVVDDDGPNLAVIALLLDKLGYTPITVNNGWDGLAIIEEKMPDLIILDLMMDPLDGWQFLDELKKKGPVRVPVIIFTAKYVSAEEIAPYRDDIILLLQKPITFPELKAVLETSFKRGAKASR